MTPFRLTKLDRFLSADGELQPVVAKMRDLRALAALVHGFLSADLARHVRVGNLKEGKLTLIAENSAAAAKLQLLAPAVTRIVQDQRWQVNSVSVRVQPNGPRAAPQQKQKTVYLSTHAIDALRDLHGRMTPSPAREALGKMLRRHGGLRKN
ncbi:MAG TPA: DciA family protein [Burkholderiales bacterium]|nr:DciA family protein [Burkholderiales bacterium]